MKLACVVKKLFNIAGRVLLVGAILCGAYIFFGSIGFSVGAFFDIKWLEDGPIWLQALTGLGASIGIGAPIWCTVSLYDWAKRNC